MLPEGPCKVILPIGRYRLYSDSPIEITELEKDTYQVRLEKYLIQSSSPIRITVDKVDEDPDKDPFDMEECRMTPQ